MPRPAEPGRNLRPPEAAGAQAGSSSGCRAATMARMPSRQATLVPPTSSCIRVRSIWTLSMVSRVGAGEPGRQPGQLGEVAAPLLDADRVDPPPQLTVVAGVVAAANSRGTMAMMSSWWSGW